MKPISRKRLRKQHRQNVRRYIASLNSDLAAYHRVPQRWTAGVGNQEAAAKAWEVIVDVDSWLEEVRGTR